MILRVNGTSETIWLPVYTLNGDHETLYLILGALEIISYLITALVVLKTCRIIAKSRQFHGNMNLLVVCFMAQWFEALFSKIAIMPYQVGFWSLNASPKVYICWWTSDPDEMILVPDLLSTISLSLPGILIWHYIYSMFVALVGICIERTCATYYNKDYENRRRKHIGVGLIILVHCISFPFAYLMIMNRICFVVADLLCIACVMLVCMMYTILWYINERMRRNFSKPGAFRLAQQFQVKENIRHIMLTKNIICSATIYVAISCSLLMILVLDMVPAWLKNPLAHCVENCIFLNPLLICTVSIFSEPAWKKEFIQSIPLISHVFRTDKQSSESKKSLQPVEETEMYFNQFKMAWV